MTPIKAQNNVLYDNNTKSTRSMGGQHGFEALSIGVQTTLVLPMAATIHQMLIGTDTV